MHVYVFFNGKSIYTIPDILYYLYSRHLRHQLFNNNMNKNEKQLLNVKMFPGCEMHTEAVCKRTGDDLYAFRL